MNTARHYTTPGVHHAVVQQGMIQASTVHHWDFSRKPKRRSVWRSALMALFLSMCTLILGVETILYWVSK